MFIDKDSWGKYSINDLDEKDLRLLYEGLKLYAQQNFGRIHPRDNERLLVFDYEYKDVMSNE